MSDAEKTREREVRPQLPTSVQLLGALAKNLGIDDSKLRDRTPGRFFSGQFRNRVKDSSRREVIEALAEALDDLAVGEVPTSSDDGSPPPLVEILDWHALNWDRLRAFLLPRMARVYPIHLSATRVIRPQKNVMKRRSGAGLAQHHSKLVAYFSN